MTETDEPSTDGSNRRRVILRRVASVLGVLLLLAIVIPFVIYAVPQVAGAEHSYVVLSGSMEPAMSPGDVTIVNDVSPNKIEKGDIITFTRGEQTNPTTHRVIEVVQQENGASFKTKGDNNENADQALVESSQVVGRVPTIQGQPFVIPWIGYVIRFASTQTGIAALIILPIGLLILSEIWSMAASLRSGSDESSPDTASSTDGSQEKEHAGSEEIIDPSVLKHEVGQGSTTRPITHVDSAAVSSGFSPSQQASNGGSAGGTDGTEVIVVAADDEGSTGQDTDSSESAVTFSAPELELGLVVLAAFLAYSVWVAVKTIEVWAFAVAGSAGAAFLLLSILYVAGRLGSTDESSESGDEPAAEPEPTVSTDVKTTLNTKEFRNQLETAVARAELVSESIGNGQADAPIRARQRSDATPDNPEITTDGRGPVPSVEEVSEDE